MPNPEVLTSALYQDNRDEPAVRLMSMKFMNWVWDHSPYEGTMLVVHLALADWCNDDGLSLYPKVKQIALKARCTERRAQQVLAQMIEDGFLVRTASGGGRGRPAQFRLLRPETLQQVSVKPETVKPVSVKPEAVKGEIQSHERVKSSADTYIPNKEPSVEPPCPSPTAAPSAAPMMPEVSDDARRLADLMADLIASRDGAKRPTVTRSWLTAMDRLIRLDGRAPDQIERTLRWLDAAADPVSEFWRPNVRSPEKLRERWDQMREQHASRRAASPAKATGAMSALEAAAERMSAGTIRPLFGNQPTPNDPTIVDAESWEEGPA
jgi:hypothetical protein